MVVEIEPSDMVSVPVVELVVMPIDAAVPEVTDWLVLETPATPLTVNVVPPPQAVFVPVKDTVTGEE
jgi:hypothetical protein